MKGARQTYNKNNLKPVTRNCTGRFTENLNQIVQNQLLNNNNIGKLVCRYGIEIWSAPVKQVCRILT